MLTPYMLERRRALSEAKGERVIPVLSAPWSQYLRFIYSLYSFTCLGSHGSVKHGRLVKSIFMCSLCISGCSRHSHVDSVNFNRLSGCCCYTLLRTHLSVVLCWEGPESERASRSLSVQVFRIVKKAFKYVWKLTSMGHDSGSILGSSERV